MPRRGSARRTSNSPSTRSTSVGDVRRGQLVSTYGVGAMIAADERSFIVTAIDRWSVPREPDLQEFRLQQRLGVQGFQRPPAPDKDAPGADGVHVRLFPDWYTCPGPAGDRERPCTNNLAPRRAFGSMTTNRCSACNGALTPSRFVVACGKGHLDDFPYWEWVHRGRDIRPAEGERCRMSFLSNGRTSALRSIVIRCSCGAESSMEGSFGGGALFEIGYSCRGGRPWIGRDAALQGCDAPPRTLQRGSSSAWFSVVSSALSIPPFTDDLHRRIAPHVRGWAGLADEVIIQIAGNLGLLEDFSPEELLRAVRQRDEYGEGDPEDSDIVSLLRQEEYRQLLREKAGDGDFETVRSGSNDQPVPGIVPSMLVTRLREVRALHGFTRVDPPTGPRDTRVVDVHGEDRPSWLPAVEVIGEGVFLRLDVDRLEKWEGRQGPGSPNDRAASVLTAHEEILREHGTDQRKDPSPVTSRLMLVHTLAHAVINEWSLEAGYPAASLRERLYVSDEMAGLLIYTASSDSAGSLGGLVERGRPNALRRSLLAALGRASWCSSDPLCIESETSGVDGLNLAACHSCLLLPETSCEHNNTFLDRALLVGTPDNRSLGYFADVVDL